MKTDIERLKERFANANSEAEIEAIDKEMKALADKDKDQFAEGLVECIKDTNKEADEVLLREKLESVLPFIQCPPWLKHISKGLHSGSTNV